MKGLFIGLHPDEPMQVATCYRANVSSRYLMLLLA